MSWDRVIQDSDEDEPLEGDELEDLPSSVDPLQAPEPAVQQPQYRDVPAKHAAHNAVNEAPSAPDESMFPQFNVNFDEFLQSQDRSHALLSSSQLRREEKWIPSNSEGGSGSVGGMMAEIGLAQRRLLDDDLSSAGQQLPSTATQFSMQSACAPFPTGSSFHPVPGQLESDSFAYIEAPNETNSNANQSLLSSRQGIYELTPNTSSNSMVSPPKSVPHDVADFPRFPEQENPTSISTHIIAVANAYQPDFYSPHDTEPMSSVVSMRLNELRSDTAGTSLVSARHSQTSAPDELPLPAVPVPFAAPVPKKKRGRPKKKSIPDSDEDDELAFAQDLEFEQPSANGAIHPSDSDETTELNTAAPGGVSNETNKEDLEPLVKPGKSEPKEPKKKKAKKEKTAPAPQPGPGNDDEVIWVDSKPIVAEPIRNETNPEPTVLDSNPPKTPKTAQTTAKENTPQPVQNNDQPGPKKRGRKRKKPAEQTPADSPVSEPVEWQTKTETPAPEVSVVVDNSPNSVPASNSEDKHTPEIQDKHQDQVPQPQAPANPEPHPITNETPQTPSKPTTNPVETPQNQSQNAGKGPIKHSPISARSAVPLRVGLSKRARIAPLLKMVRK
ncbi:uncharacterized protein N7446_006059 [Penicillium canescens]|uniref:Uncharacterized protein n=1 Tax=Penicillium canescens TaxID=5083 RepID=A0AAD6IJ05_PENCN|nr:uncharacterized protein N7446_006059 [Penicillium canescens]KAJ6051427.1 hypothetical protein N7460_001961 [Penicillium canescens]KAJ6061939.1 hypothetical protein N7446_006059 [Penicillium canescens]KAJ6065190.1 hypothetical protein N7444_000843 [Penicillium canescens]